MMKSIINVRRSSICWRGRRELITDVRKWNHGYDVIVGGELFTDYSDHPRKRITLNPKLKSTGWTLQLLSRWWDAYRKSSLAWKTSLRKVRTLWHCSRLRSVAMALPTGQMWWSIRQAIDRCNNIWASLPGAGYQFSMIAWLQNSKKRAEQSIDVWASLPIISALVICIIDLPVWKC